MKRTNEAITDILLRIGAVWFQMPELRLGQLIFNAIDGVCCDPFYLEDGDLAEKLEAYLARCKEEKDD